MKVLAFDTSTAVASVAIAESGRVLASRQHSEMRSHAEFLNAGIESLITEAGWSLSDLDFILTGQGPGSFTGVRVSITVARALGMSLNKKIRTMDTPSLLFLQKNKPSQVLVMMNAFKNMVYCAAWKENIQILKTGVMTIPVLDEWIRQNFEATVLVLGDGFNVYSHLLSPESLRLLSRDAQFSDHPSAALLAEHGSLAQFSSPTLEWKSLIPLYLRASEAEENLRTKEILAKR